MMQLRSWITSVAVHGACVGALATAWWTTLPTRKIPVRLEFSPSAHSMQAVLHAPTSETPGPEPFAAEEIPLDPPGAQVALPEPPGATEPATELPPATARESLFDCLRKHARRRLNPPRPEQPPEPPRTRRAPTSARSPEATSVRQQPIAPAPKPSTATPKPTILPAAPLADGSNRGPDYPKYARRRGLEGIVRLRLSIDSAGRVLSAHIAAGSGHRSLDEAARRAVLNWRYHPASRAGRAIASTIEQEIEFALR